MIRLRDYQTDGVELLRAAYGRGRRAPLYVLPTGGGKTVLFCAIVRRAVERGGRVLLLVHRRELIQQASAALDRFDVSHGVVAPGYPSLDRPVQVASVQTIARRLGRYPADAFSLVVIDEAHHAVAGTWAKTLGHFAGARLLGVTATPIRLDGRGLAGAFDEMVVGPSPLELVEAGHLAKARVFAPPIGFSTAGLRSRMGEYDLEEAERRVGTVRALGETVAHYRQLLDGGTAIAFCCSIKHAEAVAAEFQAAGIAAASIDGSMSWDDRRDRLDRLERGELKVLSSCMLIGEGVDVPSVNGCLLLRPTKSVSLFLQMVGRCLRPAPGKETAVVLDHVGNYAQHGHHLQEREWTLEEGIRRRAGRETGPSLWVCPSCYCTLDSGIAFCSECGVEKPRQERRVEVVGGRLEELSEYRAREREMRRFAAQERRREQAQATSFEGLVAIGRRRGMRYPHAWARKVIESRGRRRYA